MASHMENENENENEIENELENAVERAENPEIFFGIKCAISVDRKRARGNSSVDGRVFCFRKDLISCRIIKNGRSKCQRKRERSARRNLHGKGHCPG